MAEEKKGIVSAFQCLVQGCGVKFVTRADCWHHMEEHGLAAYYAPVLVVVDPEPVKPEPVREQQPASAGEME
jgi:hypothetical protein